MSRFWVEYVSKRLYGRASSGSRERGGLPPIPSQVCELPILQRILSSFDRETGEVVMGAERWDEETSTLYTCAEYGEVTDGVEMDEAPVQAE